MVVGDEVLDVVFRRHAQARRLVLRLNATGTGVLVTVPRGRYDELKAVMDVPRELVAPFAAGQLVGTVKVSLDDKVIAQAPLVAVAAVEEAGFFKRLWHSLLMWWNS